MNLPPLKPLPKFSTALLLATAFPLLWLSCDPRYRFEFRYFSLPDHFSSVIGFLFLLSPLLLLFAFSTLLSFLPFPSPLIPLFFHFFLFGLLFLVLYLPLFFAAYSTELVQADWIVRSPYFSIRRLWSPEEMIMWVEEYTRLHPTTIPFLPSESFLWKLALSSDFSISQFKFAYLKVLNSTPLNLAVAAAEDPLFVTEFLVGLYLVFLQLQEFINSFS